jgi:hypothetical protein
VPIWRYLTLGKSCTRASSSGLELVPGFDSAISSLRLLRDETQNNLIRLENRNVCLLFVCLLVWKAPRKSVHTETEILAKATLWKLEKHLFSNDPHKKEKSRQKKPRPTLQNTKCDQNIWTKNAHIVPYKIRCF